MRLPAGAPATELASLLTWTRLARNTTVTRQLETYLRLAGLWALAIAQPLLDTLARGPEFLVAQRADALDILLLTASLVLAPPLLLTGIVAGASTIGRRTASVTEAVLCGLLVSTLAIQAGYRAGISGWSGAAIVGTAVAALAAAAWLRFAAFRAFTTVAALAALVVPAVFLAAPGIRPMIWRSAEQALASGVEASAPVVLLVFDELPLVSVLDARGEIDSGRFPALVKLASDGIWFRNATTSSDYTRWALPAILTGRRPAPASTPLFEHHPRNLFTLLGSSHRIEALEPITALCPPQLCAQDEDSRRVRLGSLVQDLTIVGAYVFLPPDARRGLPSLTANWAGFGEQRREADGEDPDRPLWRRIWDRRIDENHARSALRFVEGIAPGDAPATLYFMHTLASHHPLRWLPSGQAVEDPRRVPGLVDDVWTDDPWPVVQFHQGHLIQAGLVDTIVGRVVARLENAGLYEDALVIVTSDHGISFNPGDELRSVTDTNAGDIVPVPLIVKLPREYERVRRGAVDDRLVESIDLLPTVADALGIELPWPVDGLSALGSERRRAVSVYVRDQERTRVFDEREIAAGRAEALSRKLARFGDARWPVASPPALRELPGMPVSALDIGRGSGLRAHVDRPYAWRRVRLDGPSLPIQIRGRIEPAARASRRPVPLAIGVNGTIAAVSETWRNQAGWMALLPPEALREGENRVEVFAVDRSSAQRLVLLPSPVPDPRGVNLLFAEAAEWGVERDGLFGTERSGRTRFRWTDGAATITVPLPRGATPGRLDVDVRSSGPSSKQFRVLVDDCEVVSETLEGGAVDRSASLERCQVRGSEVVLRILSDTHQPRRDERRLGVALSRVALR